jgi:hypothetical protein
MNDTATRRLDSRHPEAIRKRGLTSPRRGSTLSGIRMVVPGTALDHWR